MGQLYPLGFQPIYKERVWGGRRLATSLGKPLPAVGIYGESWELVDLPGDQSRVAHGPLAGAELGALVDALGGALMGPVSLDAGHFPLLVKYIDAAQTLSVQVHPDGETAARLGGRAKAEAWYILAAEPGATIYLGLQPGVSAVELQAALGRGDVERLLCRVPARAGDLFAVPPGTVHALGGGVLLAEVQQPSDTTYRVHDWGRLGLDGNPRELHVAQALQSIHFDAAPAAVQDGGLGMGWFDIRLLTLGPQHPPLEGDGPAVLVGLEGRATLAHAGGESPCGAGDVILVPHVCRDEVSLAASDAARALWVTFPRSSR